MCTPSFSWDRGSCGQRKRSVIHCFRPVCSSTNGRRLGLGKTCASEASCLRLRPRRSCTAVDGLRMQNEGCLSLEQRRNGASRPRMQTRVYRTQSCCQGHQVSSCLQCSTFFVRMVACSLCSKTQRARKLHGVNIKSQLPTALRCMNVATSMCINILY